MKQITLIFTFAIILSCNNYELDLPEPKVRVNIHVVNKEEGNIYQGFKGVIRASDFSRARTSTFFHENIESVYWDSSMVNKNGNIAFDLPFSNEVPLNYYELHLSKDFSSSLIEGRFLNEYIQHDTIRIGNLTQIDVKIKNDSCRVISFSTLGYRKEADYKQDSINFFTNPDYVARLGKIRSKDTLISKIVPYECNNIMVLQLIYQDVWPPQLVKYDVIKMQANSIHVQCIEL
jgi:hypothetical protein